MKQRSPRRRSRSARRAVGAAVALVWVAMPTSAPAQAPTPSAPVQLDAVESFESAPMLAATAMMMSGATSEFTYADRVEGTSAVRRHFIDGGVDFAVSGVPFTSEETKELSDAGRAVIAAPVQAVGLSVFGFAPSLPVFPGRCVQEDPESEDGCTLFDAVRYDGPVQLTPKLLADLFYESANIWLRPELAANLDLPDDGTYFLPPIYGPRPLVRLDGDATNLYLDRYLQAKVPEERRQALASVPGGSTDVAPSELWPLPLTPARRGQDNLVAQISNGLDPGAGGQSMGGSVGIVGEFAVRSTLETNRERPVPEQVGLFRVNLLNDAGKWVAPTTDSISAGVAGAGAELAAAFAKGDAAATAQLVPAAEAEYPITWVNHLYAPTTGLTPAKANAIASMIRVQVTAGQSAASLEAMGDGRLTPEMVAEALAAADSLVRSNCAAAKATVVTVKGHGPFVPSTLEGAPEAVSMCVAEGESVPTGPPATVGGLTTGPASGGTVSGSGYSGGVGSSFADADYGYGSQDYDSSGGVEALGADGTAAGPDGGKGDVSADVADAALIATRMPLPIPGLALAPLDRAVTLAIGAAAFLIGRRAWVRRQGLA